MGEWKSTIDLSDIFKEYDDLESADKLLAVSVNILAKKVAQRIRENKFCNDEELQEIACLFDECEEEDEFNSALDELYDFGDTNKRIWIEGL